MDFTCKFTTDKISTRSVKGQRHHTYLNVIATEMKKTLLNKSEQYTSVLQLAQAKVEQMTPVMPQAQNPCITELKLNCT